MSQLAAQVAQYIARHRLLEQGQGVVVGVSGGADSVCLLRILRDLALDQDLWLTVAHLNHGLRGADSDADAEFVAALAAEWGLPLALERIDVAELARAGRLSIEEAARQARYAFLARVARAAGAPRIAVAHHAGDQAETVLMHFLRGSGVAGLRGMLPIMPLSDYRTLGEDLAGDKTPPYLVRPLLSATRAEIEAYCRECALSWRTDASNADTRFYRNRLRHELLPVLAQYNPRIDEVLARTADVMAGDYEMIEPLAEESLRLIRLDAPSGVIAFDRERWQSCNRGLQRAVIRQAVRELRPDLRNVGLEHVDRAVEVATYGQSGDSATITGGLALFVDHKALQIGPEFALPVPLDVASRPHVTEPLRVTAPGTLPLANDWRMEVVELARDRLPAGWMEPESQWLAYLDADRVGAELTLRPRQPGDRFRPLGLGGHTARVNEYMINRKVPAGDRATWPLLVGANDIAWVCGLRVDETAAITPNTQRVWRVRFRK
jgi:tRNA(Ile)-lysidine synthase